MQYQKLELCFSELENARAFSMVIKNGKKGDFAGDITCFSSVQIPLLAPTTFFETNTNRLALFLFPEEFGVFPLGFFYFDFRQIVFSNNYQQIFIRLKWFFMSIIKLNDIHFLKSFLLHFQFFFRYTVIDGKPYTC